MPYRCVHCSETYQDGSSELLVGCRKCQGKFFFYIKPEKLQNSVSPETNLNEDEKKQVEQDVREITGIEDEDLPVFLDFESVSVIKPGKYLIDVSRLFSINKPRVYKLEDGKYIVDLSLAFKNQKDENSK